MDFTVKKDGKTVGTIKAADGRVAGARAIMRWGPGTYDVSMVRDTSRCISCGANLHGGEDFDDVCMDCDNFGDEEP